MDQTVYLGSLQKGREKRAIIVRVIRKWTIRENAGQGEPLYVGTVLADAKVTFVEKCTISPCRHTVFSLLSYTKSATLDMLIFLANKGTYTLIYSHSLRERPSLLKFLNK